MTIPGIPRSPYSKAASADPKVEMKSVARANLEKVQQSLPSSSAKQGSSGGDSPAAGNEQSIAQKIAKNK